MKVYVGCGLTHAPESFKADIEALKEKIRGVPGVEVLCFLGVVGGTFRDVYLHDIHECVYQCDLLVAVCDYASIGLGWEMATQAEKRKKPLIAMAQTDSKITRLVLDPGLPDYEFHRYKSLLDDGFDLVRAAIEKFACNENTPLPVTMRPSILGEGH